MSFQREIVNWYFINKRNLPWRTTTDAYVIWLSEIILQQTRVEQGLPYFYKFLEQYPTVTDFAMASETQILKLWQGLGYYSRGRNMLHTARQVLELYAGVFPVRYQDLIKLKGIGEYTAAAISSFSSGENKAVVDGNVYRVLSRYFGIETPVNSTKGKSEFADLASDLIKDQDSAIYNQAIMEFGALLCKPKSPFCEACPVRPGCKAYQENRVNILPVKLKKTVKKTRFFNYFICADQDQILVNHRPAGDIWQQLYDFPLLETEQEVVFSDDFFIKKTKERFGENVVVSSVSGTRHLLTHQIIYVQFFVLDNYIINFNNKTTNKWVTWTELDHLPQPKVIANYLFSFLTKQPFSTK
jgi:A/G-specific adenine glycosylase